MTFSTVVLATMILFFAMLFYIVESRALPKLQYGYSGPDYYPVNHTITGFPCVSAD